MSQNRSYLKIFGWVIFVCLVIIFVIYLITVYNEQSDDPGKYGHPELVYQGAHVYFDSSLCPYKEPTAEQKKMVGAPIAQPKPGMMDKKLLAMALNHIEKMRGGQLPATDIRYGCVTTQVVAGVIYKMHIIIGHEHYLASIYRKPDQSYQVTVSASAVSER